MQDVLVLLVLVFVDLILNDYIKPSELYRFFTKGIEITLYP